MKKLLSTLIFVSILMAGIASTDDVQAKSVRVKGYYKKSSGTYVQPHYRSSPNRSKFDNWSSKGNFNPYTGKKGTKNLFRW